MRVLVLIVLKQFVLFPDRLLTDQVLLDGVWGKDHTPGEHALHVYIARLRKKLEDDPQAPAYLITEVGAGYRLAVELQEQPTRLDCGSVPNPRATGTLEC